MNRTNRMNESRTLRTEWMREARRTDRFTIERAAAMRKVRFHHANLMSVKLAEWA